MTEREALKLALEALELHGKQYPHMVKGYCLDAITAIKEALNSPNGEAQPALASEQRSVSDVEPVATLDDLEQEIYENTRQFVSRDVMEWMLKRYYTTPPTQCKHCLQRTAAEGEDTRRAWVGLTDEEMQDLWDRYAHMEMMRAIEAKLKEKNNG